MYTKPNSVRSVRGRSRTDPNGVAGVWRFQKRPQSNGRVDRIVSTATGGEAENTGIYWKSPYAALEKQGICALVVNARHVMQVPGRKTDFGDAQWLAILARSGLLRGSFVPPQELRVLRLISRQMQKMTGILSEKNRMHKVLTDGGIRLAMVVSDIHGKSSRAMIKGLLRGETPEQVLQYAGKRLARL
uniref:Transposase n=1 Tax=Candidatus Kentrum sp. MB TaxID=2138164 RepID=A0A450Y3J2_9GAMM|nr:MAG: Transposase [Candidatus Kentron sp. MB]